jgi:hypothetical protein
MNFRDDAARGKAAGDTRAHDPAAGFYRPRDVERPRSRLQRFFARELAQSVMRTIGSLLNARNSKLYLAYRPDSHFDFDGFPHFTELYRSFVYDSEIQNAGDLPRLYLLLLNIARVLKDGIAGDFAEIGVYKGNTARILAGAARAEGRQLFLFDTFSGFDAADQAGSDNPSRSFTDTSLEAVKQFVGAEAVTYVAGRFPDSLAQVAMPERFALVHLDCDLYQPTLAGLSYFYPRLSSGGLLILHDYSSGHWSGCAQAIDEFMKGKPERPVLLPDKSGTAIVVKV